jgi:signal transduction histidine kinase
MLAALTVQRLVVTLSLATAAAFALNPVFITPLPVLLGRFVVIAVLLLLVFNAAGLWTLPGVPRWLAQVLAVSVAAPIATLIVYLPSVRGDVGELFGSEARVLGFIWITGVVLVVAPILALGALYRERDAQARSQALQFALEKAQLEKQALDAQLRLLQAQIEPHFLFNTLANVQALVEAGSPRAAALLQSLIAYLRAAVPRLNDDHATLGDEATLVRAYLELMRMRMPDRLQFEVDIAPDLARERFPTMALLTLVENAIRHGIDPSEKGGRVVVHAMRDGAGALQVSVSDTGPGMSEKSVAGLGLTNLRARLAGFFGARARLELSEQSPHGLRADIVVPAAAP